MWRRPPGARPSRPCWSALAPARRGPKAERLRSRETAPLSQAGSPRNASAELPGDVVLGELLLRILEDLLSRPHLHEIPSAPALGHLDREECGRVGDPRRF